MAAEMLAVWTEAEAGLALGRLQPPPLVARVLEAIVLQSPTVAAGEAVRAIRQVSRPAVIAATFECMPQPKAVAIIARMAAERAITVLQQVDPARSGGWRAPARRSSESCCSGPVPLSRSRWPGTLPVR